MKKIIIAGGTGFIGTYLRKQFEKSGYEVLIVSRQPGAILWEERPRIIAALENSALLINLAGKSVNCRYHSKNREEILFSRTVTTQILGEAIGACRNPPPLWINSSTATIYRHAEDRPMTEANGELGSGFSVEVAKSWEESFFSFKPDKTRQVALRMAIVLGRNGGVMKPFQNLVRFGLGGKQGSGKQMFSWLHIEDLFRIILFLQQQAHLEGVFNCAAPQPVRNEDLMKMVRDRMHIRLGLASPSWLLNIGAAVIKTETELILKSRWVIPERLEQAGYIFRFPTLQQALTDILSHS